MRLTLNPSALIALLILIVPLQITQARVTDDQVKNAIAVIVNRLYNLQNERGTWDPEEQPSAGDEEAGHQFGINWGGTTALATYALLTAGESYQNPKLKRAIEFLATANLQGVYARGIRNHVWSHLPPKFEPQMKADTKWLVDAIGGGPVKWGYHYTPAMAHAGSYDNSVSQYGVLGAWEGAKRGVGGISDAYWDVVEKHFFATQHADGGWDYNGAREPYAAMTAAGLACLFITQNYIHSNDYRTPGKAAKSLLSERIDKGIEWFDKNYKVEAVPYTLVGIERVGLASGIKYFKGQDWYEQGASILIGAPFQDVVNNSFSLIFLVRGRVPVFINKLRINDYSWNNRPRDLAHLAHWVSDEVEQEMNWQVVDLLANPEDWLDAPILYISSHEPLKLKPEEEQKLKRFIDLGGLIITTADTGEVSFSKSVQDLYERLYPQYKLEKLANDDELMDMVFPLKANRMGILSLHNGVRHLAIHMPRDISWTFHASVHSDPYPWQFFANAYYYATEKGQARPRLAEHFNARQQTGGGPKFEIARMQYEGNWNPEPLAWEIQANYMFNSKKADVTVKDVVLDQLNASGVKFAHIVGTAAHDFSEVQAAEIKKYVDAGGVVFFENAGGRGDFTQSAVKMMTALYPGNPIRPLSTQSRPISGQGIGGVDVSKVDYRAYTLLKTGRFNSPRIQAMNIDGQPRVFISNEDLTMSLLNRPIWGVYGYSTPSARDLISNMVLWSQAPPPAAVAPVPAAPAPAAVAAPVAPVATP